MTIPRDEQTVHLMTFLDALRIVRQMRRSEKRDAAGPALHTTEDLRRRYQDEPHDIIRLRDGIVTRVQLVAEIHLRIFLSRISHGVLLFLSLVTAAAPIAAAMKG